MDADPPDLDPELKEEHLPSSLRLEVQPYRPDGGAPLLGLLILVTITAAAAIGAGRVLSQAVNKWFYIIVLFPALAGALAAHCGVLGITLGKIRNAIAAGTIGFLAGLLCIAAMHYFDYLRFAEAMEDPPRRKVVVGVLVRPGDRDLGFLEYVDRKAEKGVIIRFFGLKAGLGYIGSYIYWACEALLAALAALAVLASNTAAPFCTECNEWKNERKLGRLNMAPETAHDIVARGELVRLADRISRDSPGHIHLTVWSCPKCKSEGTVDVKLDEVFQNQQGASVMRPLAFVTFPGKALPILESLFVPGAAVAESEDES